MKFLNRYIFIPVLLIVFVYIFFFVYQEVKNKTIDQFNDEQILIAKSASQGITDYLGNLQSNLVFLSKFPEIIDLNENGLEIAKNFFNNRSTQIEAITRTSSTGILLYTYPENKKVLGMDISNQKHLGEIIKEQKPVISDVFMAVQGYLAIAVHVPVFKGNEFQGSLAVLIAIDKIGKRYLENIKKGESGYALLLSENNIEIFCPFHNHISKSIVEISQNDPTVLNLTDLIKKSDFGTVNCYHDTSEKLAKTERNVNYYRVPLGNTYWTILISNPQSAVIETIAGFRNRLVILYAVFLVSILVYFYFFIKAKKVLKEGKKRKIAENALSESEEKYRLLHEAAGVGIAYYSVNGEVITYNTIAAQYLGGKPEDFVGKSIFDLFPKDIASIYFERIRKACLAEKPQEYEDMVSLPKGNIWFNSTYTRINNSNKKNIGIQIISTDITQRKKAEEELKKSESLLKQSQEIAHIGNWELNVITNHLYWSDETYRIFGLKPNELTPSYAAFLDFIHPDDREAVDKAYSTSVQKGKDNYEIDHRIIRKHNGEIRFVHEKCNHDFTPDGKLVRSIGIVQDITERKQAEKEILLTKERYKSLFNESPVPLWEEDISELMAYLNELKKEGIDNIREYFDNNPNELVKCFDRIKISDVNQATLQLHGAKTKDELLSNLDKIFTENSFIQFKEEIIAITRGITQFESESETKTLTGELKYINLNLKIGQSNQNLNRAIVATVDITGRKHAEAIVKEADNRINQTLMESEKRYRTLFENINAGFVLFEVVQNDKGIPVDLIIVAANELFEKTTGLINTEVTGKLLTKVLPGIENDAADWIGTYGKVALSGEAKQFEQGSELLGFYYSVMAFQAQPNQCAVTFLDITENKNAQEKIKSLNRDLEKRVDERTQELSNSRIALLNLVEDIHEKTNQLEQSSKKLESKNKELETFTYSVSHDLKAPLRGIDGYSRLLEEMYSDKLTDEGNRFIKSIREGTTQMNQLIEDLLSYSRLERSIIRNSKFRINDLLENILKMLKNEISNNHVTVEMNIDNIEIETDYDGLSIIMRNLIDNAIKFSGKQKNPQIKILLKENVYSWQLQVEDNGIGFDMKYHNRIFEIFQRLNLPEQFAGTGIGLAMVSKSVERLKAKIWAESSPGNGAKFYLEIPKNHKS